MEKMSEQIGVKLPRDLAKALARIAVARSTTPQEFLRRAAWAIAAYAAEFGDDNVPLDLAITPWRAPERTQATSEKLDKWLLKKVGGGGGGGG